MKPCKTVKWQFLWALVLCFLGLVLLFSAFWVPPIGVVDSSVLVAFGEILTFVGALLGMDYKYRFMTQSNKQNG